MGILDIPKYSLYTIISIKEKQQILSFKKLQKVNVWHFSSKKFRLLKIIEIVQLAIFFWLTNQLID